MFTLAPSFAWLKRKKTLSRQRAKKKNKKNGEMLAMRDNASDKGRHQPPKGGFGRHL